MTLKRNLTLVAAIDEIERLDQTWKETPGYFNRSQFIRDAVNEKAGRIIW